MSEEIFLNQTTNTESIEYPWEGGNLQVDIEGVLDGADVKTIYLNDNGISTTIADLSWQTSKADTLVGTDGGVRFLNKKKVKFIIENAGASTDISLWADLAYSLNS